MPNAVLRYERVRSKAIPAKGGVKLPEPQPNDPRVSKRPAEERRAPREIFMRSACLQDTPFSPMVGLSVKSVHGEVSAFNRYFHDRVVASHSR
jgi:hypothetical protein